MNSLFFYTCFAFLAFLFSSSVVGANRNTTTADDLSKAAALRGSHPQITLPNPMTHSVDPSRYQNIRWEDHADPKIQKYFRSRQLYVSALNATMHQHVPNHKKAWQALEEVNGLKNEDVLIFVTSTSAKDEIYMWER